MNNSPKENALNTQSILDPVTVEKAINIYFEHYENLGKIEAQIFELVDEKTAALQLFLFIPTGFCREILPEVNYTDLFINTQSGEEVTYHFSKNSIYQEILKSIRSKWDQYGKLDFQKILIHSSEYVAIKAAIKNGQSIHSIETTPARMMSNS